MIKSYKNLFKLVGIAAWITTLKSIAGRERRTATQWWASPCARRTVIIVKTSASIVQSTATSFVTVQGLLAWSRPRGGRWPTSPD